MEIWTVIVTYNSTQWMKTCLDSILNSSLVPRIVVVDNNSADDTTMIVQKLYPKVILLKSPENIGFGQACNLGMKYALDEGAQYIVQMNDDAQLTESTLSTLLHAAVNQPEFGIFIPLNITYDGEIIDDLFAMELGKNGPSDLLNHALMGKMEEVYEVPVLPGAVLLVKREVLIELGGFDPLFFVLGVEYDFCFRTAVSHWKVGFVPGAVVYHEYNKPKSGHSSKTVRKHLNDFYATSLFILKKPDHSFLYMTFYEGMYFIYQFQLALTSGNWKRVIGITLAVSKIVKALPTVRKHRRICVMEHSPFLHAIP